MDKLYNPQKLVPPSGSSLIEYQTERAVAPPMPPHPHWSREYGHKHAGTRVSVRPHSRNQPISVANGRQADPCEADHFSSVLYVRGRVCASKIEGNCSAMPHSHSCFTVCVAGCVCQRVVVSFGVAEWYGVHVCVGGCERQRGRVLWWSRLVVVTLGVRERTATQVIVWEDIMARKAKAVVSVMGRYAKCDKWWTVAFDNATEVLETGTVVDVRKVDGSENKVIIQSLIASSIVESDEQNPTLFYTYTKVSSK